MTGQKDRYSTQEKLWKLDDEQLTTPKHDEMVLDILSNGESVYNKFKRDFKISVGYKILRGVEGGNQYDVGSGHLGHINFNSCYSSSSTLEYDRIAIKHFDSISNDFTEIINQNIINSTPTPKILSEQPLKTKSGFLIGFLDILLYSPFVERTYTLANKIYDDLFQYNLYQDIRIHPNSLGIEIKPTIPSFGQTLRQLNTYREYFDGKLMLYTTDIKFKSAFESQGIEMITPSDINMGD